MPKRTPEEILKALEDADIDDEMDRILAMTEEERRGELDRAGVDLAAVHAEADALHAEIQGRLVARSESDIRPKVALPGAVARGKPPRQRSAPPDRWVVLLAAAMVAVAGVAVAIPTVIIPLATRGGEGAQPPSREAQATQQRREAARACHEKRWVECRRRLDAARELDPPGDESREVRDLRRAIDEAPPPARPSP